MDFPFKKQHVVYVEASLAFKLCIPFVSSPCLIAFLPPPSDHGNEWDYLIAKTSELTWSSFCALNDFLGTEQIQLPDINIQQETSQNWRLVSE